MGPQEEDWTTKRKTKTRHICTWNRHKEKRRTQTIGVSTSTNREVYEENMAALLAAAQEISLYIYLAPICDTPPLSPSTPRDRCIMMMVCIVGVESEFILVHSLQDEVKSTAVHKGENWRDSWAAWQPYPLGNCLSRMGKNMYVRACVLRMCVGRGAKDPSRDTHMAFRIVVGMIPVCIYTKRSRRDLSRREMIILATLLMAEQARLLHETHKDDNRLNYRWLSRFSARAHVDGTSRTDRCKIKQTG